MINQMFDFSKNERRKFVFLNDEIQHTTNLFEGNEIFKKAVLMLVEQADNGDCMCLVNNSYLVDVDKRDIKRIV